MKGVSLIQARHLEQIDNVRAGVKDFQSKSGAFFCHGIGKRDKYPEYYRVNFPDIRKIKPDAGFRGFQQIQQKISEGISPFGRYAGFQTNPLSGAIFYELKHEISATEYWFF
jgi:hypothetical protein